MFRLLSLSSVRSQLCCSGDFSLLEVYFLFGRSRLFFKMSTHLMRIHLMKKGLLVHQSGMVMTVTVITQALMSSLQNGLIEL
ncbi:Uncharacterised protein [Serratia grimesii]|nr:Uncharacterised protein [Serratia grimesii]